MCMTHTRYLVPYSMGYESHPSEFPPSPAFSPAPLPLPRTTLASPRVHCGNPRRASNINVDFEVEVKRMS